MSNNNVTVAQAITHGTIYSTVGNVVLKVLDFATVIILLNSLSVYGYGIYTLALTAFSFWTFLFLPGIQNLIVSDAARAEKENTSESRIIFSVYASILFGAGLILWTLFFFGGNALSYFIDGETGYLIIISWLFILSPFEAIFNIKSAILFDFGWSLAYRVIRSFSRLSFILVSFLFFSLNVTVALVSVVASLAFALSIVGIGYRRKSMLQKVGVGDFKYFGRQFIFGHGKWAVLEDMFNSTTQNIQPFLIKYFLGAEAVAMVTLAQNLLSYAKSIFPVREVLFPTLPRTDDIAQFGRYIYKLIKYSTLAYSVVMVVAFLGTPLMVHFLFPKYDPALAIFYILLLSLPAFGIRSVAVPFFYTLKAQKSLLTIVVSRTILSLILTTLLMWLFGIMGVAVGMLFTAFFTAASYFFAMKKLLPGHPLSFRYIFTFGSEDRQVIFRVVEYAKSKFRGLASIL